MQSFKTRANAQNRTINGNDGFPAPFRFENEAIHDRAAWTPIDTLLLVVGFAGLAVGLMLRFAHSGAFIAS
jgi:hypothetical protein